MEGEMTMIKESYYRMAALMAQIESNVLAKIDELARKTDEQAQTVIGLIGSKRGCVCIRDMRILQHRPAG